MAARRCTRASARLDPSTSGSPPPSLACLSPPLLTQCSVDRHPPPQTSPFIPDADASCPSLLLLLLLLLGCACTTLVNGHSLPSAFDAGAVYLGAQALSGCLTAWYKTYCGYLRPNYLEGCGWNATTHACAHEWPEGRLSFPSGHSSSSAAGATVLTLYLLRRLSDAASQRSPWKRRALALEARNPRRVQASPELCGPGVERRPGPRRSAA